MGQPLAFHRTGGEASDTRKFGILLGIGPDVAPRAALTDKGYDAASNRRAARRRGICPVIPQRSTRCSKPGFFPKVLCKARMRVEQAMGKLRRVKRVALRCEEIAENYASIVAFACGLILIKSVYTTSTHRLGALTLGRHGGHGGGTRHLNPRRNG